MASGVIHDAHFVAELAKAAGAGPQAEHRNGQLVPLPEQPLADAVLLGLRLAVELVQLIGKVLQDGGGLHVIGLAVAQRRNLAIAVLHQIVGLLVLALPQVHVNIGKRVAGQREHQRHRIGGARTQHAVEGEALLVHRGCGGRVRAFCATAAGFFLAAAAWPPVSSRLSRPSSQQASSQPFWLSSPWYMPLPAVTKISPGTDYSGECSERKTETKYLMKLEIGKIWHQPRAAQLQTGRSRQAR